MILTGLTNVHKKVMKMRKTMVLMSICLICFLSSVYAYAGFFYSGSIVIDSLSAEIDADKAFASIEYILINKGEKTEVNLSFSENGKALLNGNEFSNPVSFGADEKKKISISCPLKLGKEAYKTVIFNPVILFDGKPSSEKIHSYTVKLKLPSGVKRLVSSNKPYEQTFEDERAVVTWKESDTYLTPLFFSWSSLDVDIAATKRATPSNITSPGEIVKVEVKIQNKGKTEVKNVEIFDEFFPRAFEAVEPLEEFELVKPEQSDAHLYWKKKIDLLKPGETKSYTYSIKVKALSPETRLTSLTVLVNGIQVAASNDVMLYKEAKPEVEEKPKTQTHYPVLILGAIIGICIMIFLALKLKKKK